MSKNNKILPIVLAIMSIIAIGLISVVAAMAASTQSATASMSATYSATNVAATMKGTYQRQLDNSSTNLLNSSNGSNSLVFYATGVKTTGTLNSASAISLTSSNKYVLFVFSIKNDSPVSANSHNISAALSDSIVKTNITTYYYTTSSPSASLATNYLNTKTSGSTSIPSNVIITPQSTMYYLVLFEITNLDYNAGFTSAAGSSLDWTLTSVD